MGTELNIRSGFPSYFPTFAPTSTAGSSDDFGALMALFAWGAMDPGDAYSASARMDPGMAQWFAPAPSVPFSPYLQGDVQSMQQQLNMLGGVGQRNAPMMPWQMNFDPMQAQLLMGLLVMALLMHMFQTQQGVSPNLGQSFPGSANGGDASTGVPSTPGRDLGQLGATGSGVSPEQLRQIAPSLSPQRAQELTPHLNRAMQDANITTQRQQAAFIAQLSQESGEFKYFEEIASGEAYNGRTDLGNTQPGDGPRFKGRGPIQLTGRANYRAAGRALGLDLENNPELVSTPEIGFKVAAWYWNMRNINEVAEAGNFREVTRRINGGQNGYDVRLMYYQRAMGVV